MSCEHCDTKVYAKGLCKKHYLRVWRHGDPHAQRNTAPVLDRFWAKVKTGRSCWEWQGARTKDGYGLFWAGGKLVLVHRWAYEQFVGPIPEDEEVDHLCNNPCCVRPEHLEAVTGEENRRRQWRRRRSVR